MARSIFGGRMARFFGLCAALVAGTCVLAPAQAWAQNVLAVDGLTLDTYRASATTVQGITGLRSHVSSGLLLRGTYLDGAGAGGSGLFGLAVGTGERWSAGGTAGDVRLATATLGRLFVDMALPAPEFPWVIGRTYNPTQSASTVTSNGYQGSNWHQASQPEISVYVDGSNHANDRVYLITGAGAFAEFKRTSSSSTEYAGVNGAAGIFQYVSGSPDKWVYNEPSGRKSTFFGGNTTSSRGNWQLWKMETAAGNIAYVGHPTTESTALTSGFDASARIAMAVDTADRRYTYTYHTVNATTRLQKVVVETKTGGTWQSSPTGVTEVATVEYDHYSATVTDKGTDGDLKTVTVTTALSGSTSPLSSSSLKKVATQYYRYYDNRGWSNSDGRRGEQHTLKLFVDAEGVRGYGSAYDSGTDAALKPYSSAYFEYFAAGDNRIKTFFMNGQCGCSGGVNGTYTIVSNDVDSNFSHTTGTYDGTVGYRTVLLQPDAHYLTMYFDQAGQLSWRVLTENAPSGSPGKTWAWKGTRSTSTGVLDTIESPQNISAYSYSASTLTSKASGAGTEGRIDETSRISGTVFTGLADTQKVLRGTGGTETQVTDREYPSSPRAWQIFSGTNVTPVMLEKNRSSADATNWDETSYAYTFWSATSTDPLYIRPKTVTTTYPIITTANNGSNSANTDVRYIRKDGTTAFIKNAKGYYTYMRYNTLGLLDKRVDSVDPNGSEPASQDKTDFGLGTDSGALNLVTTYTYDSMGRLDTVTRPDGRVSKMYYTQLNDGRVVTLSIPRVVSGTTFYGPVGYTVSNHTGRGVFSGTLAISLSGSTTGLSSWIDATTSDPISAVLVGTLARMNTSICSSDGSRVDASRVYWTIPSSGTGSSSSNYDETLLGYDEMGRQVRSKTPAGTITRSKFDEAGRGYEQWLGTNDSSFPSGETSGTDNMVKTSATEFDGNSAGGNSLVTTRTAFVQYNTTGQRQTTFAYDWRGRMILQTNAAAPHTVSAYDNLDRVTATAAYTSSSGLSITTDPTVATASGAANRTSLSTSYYDQLGRVYESRRYKVTQSSGDLSTTSLSTAEYLTDLTWRDELGQVIKTRGGSLSKTYYDRLNRATHRFTLANDDDGSTYANAADVSGDKVINESQTIYDTNTGNVLMSVSIDRHAQDVGVSGALDSNADGVLTTLTAANVKGRVSITAMTYDEMDRLTNSVQLGTNAIVGNRSTTTGTFNRSSWSLPTRSDTELITTYVYNTDGTVDTVESPSDPTNEASNVGVKTRWLYDQAGRKKAEIRNYTVGGSTSTDDRTNDLYTRYTYNKGRMTEMWVDLNADGTQNTGDQVTLYGYGVTKGTSLGDSKISSNDLLGSVTYPDGNKVSAEVTYYAYNAQGQQIYVKDEDTNEIETLYDTLGRVTDRSVTTLASGYDGAVRRITTSYLTRGLVEKVTQYNAATSGSVVNEVKSTYDDYGSLTQSEQDKDSAVSGGGNQYTVSYAYSKVGSGDGSKRTTIRRTGMTLPGSDAVTYTYLNSGSLDDAFGRVTTVKVQPSGGSDVEVAYYEYLGAGRLIGTTLSQASVQDAHFTWQTVNQYSTYGKLDRFGRDKGYVWTAINAGVTLYAETATYDRSSNITSYDDAVKAGHDVKYDVDILGRVTRAYEGTLTSGAISSGSEKRDEQWKDGSTVGLSQTGNWTIRRFDKDADTSFAGAGEKDERNTYTVGNRYATKDEDNAHGAEKDFSTNGYWLAGAMKQDKATVDNYGYTYDAFGRLVQIYKVATSAVVMQYAYNGLGHRISSNVGGGATTYYYVYDDQWRMVATYRNSDSSPKETFLYHNAGMDGRGGSSYIDEVILRDRDMTNAWSGAADGTREERVYYAQNRHKDVVLLMKTTGRPWETIRYSAYGVPTSIAGCDVSNDDVVNASDTSALAGDWNLDGTVDGSDASEFNTDQGNQVGLGNLRSALTISTYGNRKGYAGYEYDGTVSFLYHVRHRVLDSEGGRWTRRDPAGYQDGTSLFQYGGSRPEIALDPSGLASCTSCAKPPVAYVGSMGSIPHKQPIELLIPMPEIGLSELANWRLVLCGLLPDIIQALEAQCNNIVYIPTPPIVDGLRNWNQLRACKTMCDITARERVDCCNTLEDVRIAKCYCDHPDPTGPEFEACKLRARQSARRCVEEAGSLNDICMSMCDAFFTPPPPPAPRPRQPADDMASTDRTLLPFARGKR